MAAQIKLRRDTSTNWTTRNPVLAKGEPGLEIDTLNVKYGDGLTTWANLAYPAMTGPQGEPGIQGNVGAQGIQGNVGPQGNIGPQGNVGLQGVSITNATVTTGNLIVTLSDTTTINAGYVVGSQGNVGAPGTNGTNGVNGLGFGSTPPSSAIGTAGDVAGLVAIDAAYIYYCVATYDGIADIWTRTPLNNAW